MTTPNLAGGAADAAELERLRRERDLYADRLATITQHYEQKIQELSLVRRLSDVLRDCSGMDDVVRRLLAIVREELYAAACSIYLADDSGALALRGRGGSAGIEMVRPGTAEAVAVPIGAGPVGETFATGQVTTRRAVPGDAPGWFPPEARDLLATPLGPDIGVLVFHFASLDDAPPDAVRLLPILAMEATIAIENAALYARLKRHSDELEARVRERTAALEHLNAELCAAAEQRARFFAHFSHELRTPLNSVLGFSEILEAGLHGALSEGQRRCVVHMREGGQRLLRLINDILDLAKMEAGKLSVQLAPMPVGPAVEQAVAVMQPQASAKHLTLTATVPATVPAALADAARFHQVVLNLLSNAIKFTPEGGSIRVVARALGEAGSPGAGQLEIAVVDTGVGIAPEDQARLFRDFEQVGAERGGGTGLGLSLSRRLVELQGGEIGVVSAPKQGSRFWFTLPTAGLVEGPGGQ